MNRSIVAVIALLVGAFASSAHAFRVIEDVENSVELELRELTLPSSPTGRVVYRTCEACPTVTQVVTQDTEYILNDVTLPLTEFVNAVEEIKTTPSVAARTIAGVFFDVHTERVTRVIILTPR
jgi:hypothetical protein